MAESRSAASPSRPDPLGDAIAVLKRIDLAALSAHPDTEDAGNRVAIALGYLCEAVSVEPQAESEPRFEEPLKRIADFMDHERREAEARRATCTCARLSGDPGSYPCPVHPEMGAAAFAGPVVEAMSSEMKALTQVWRSFNSLRQFVPPASLDRLGKDLEAYIAEAGTVARADDRERVKRNTREASKRGLI